MKSIINAAYKDAKSAWEDFEIKNIVVYYDLYVQSDTYYLQMYSNIFETSLSRYQLDPAQFLSAPILA